MAETIEKVEDVMPSSVARCGIDDPLKELNFVQRCFRVVSVRFNYFESNVAVCADNSVSLGGFWHDDAIRVRRISHDSHVISSQPNRGKMSPSQFPHNCIPSIVEIVTNVNWMVTSGSIIFEILLIVCEDGCGLRSLGSAERIRGGRSVLGGRGYSERRGCGTLQKYELSVIRTWEAMDRASERNGPMRMGTSGISRELQQIPFRS